MESYIPAVIIPGAVAKKAGLQAPEFSRFVSRWKAGGGPMELSPNLCQQVRLAVEEAALRAMEGVKAGEKSLRDRPPVLYATAGFPTPMWDKGHPEAGIFKAFFDRPEGSMVAVSVDFDAVCAQESDPAIRKPVAAFLTKVRDKNVISVRDPERPFPPFTALMPSRDTGALLMQGRRVVFGREAEDAYEEAYARHRLSLERGNNRDIILGLLGGPA